MTQDLDRHILALRQALLAHEKPAAKSEKDWLMGEVAAALLQQDAEALKALRARVCDLAPLADRYAEAQPGDRWRAVWEILHACSETIRPLEQVRLAKPGQLSGLLLRHIGDSEGITPTELGERVGKKPSHVSNTLRALAEQGLVHRVPQGREIRYFLSEMGRELLAERQPVRAVPAIAAVGGTAIKFPYVEENRLQGRDIRRLPARWGEPSAAEI